eukprot:TRINITY_DN122951_c0_g1_i1.p1 TRINITY_DN122951_c0_g1~~TRINITY_DN122951_c0_g1_i1.p1  ORF type:complete len:362 (-),score=86.10 TRINITY_DN122951_c0_g1_i1:64-1149(-)
MAARGAATFGTGSKSLQVVDLHCEGEPARVVIGGMPSIPGQTAFEMRKYLMEEADKYRRVLIQEPRGYPCQNVNFVLPSKRDDAEFAIIIGEQACVYPLMSGHNMMCTVTALLETGMIPITGETTVFNLETPGGLVQVTATAAHSKVTRVALKNVASFVHSLDVEVDVPQLGKVKVDIAYGGMHYCVVDAASVGLSLKPENGKKICKYGEMIKVACREQHPVNHPDFDYPGCDIMVFREPAPEGSGISSRNAVVMSNVELDWKREETWTGMIDRSPCGTGTSAVMAVEHARGRLKVGDVFRHQGIVDTVFEGRILEETEVHGKKAMIPEVAGRAWITQKCEVIIDPTDPFPEGYTLGDIWG